MTDNSKTSFTANVVSSFSFLVDDFGYSVHFDKGGVVVYCKHNLSVNVFCEPISKMIYVEFRHNDTGEFYLLHEVVHALSPDDETEAQCSGLDEVKTRFCLKQLSQLCQTRLGSFLDLDESTHARVAESARSARMEYTRNAQYSAIKALAEEAWDRKDWNKAKVLYERAKDGLSALEQRRLDFLIRKEP